MGLRITQAMSANRALFDLTRNALRLQQTREQLSTGRRINRPSDDPVTFLRMQPKRNEKQLVALFQDNAHLAGDVLGMAASSMEDAVQVLSRAKELAVQGANGTMGEADRRLLGKTARQLVTEMLALGNGKLGDRYLFSGTATGTMPFEMVSDASGTFVRYHGDDNPVTVEIAAGVEVDVTSSGRSMFLPGARTRTSFEGATGARPGVGTDSGRGLHTLSVEWTGLSGLPAGLSAGTTPATILGDHAWTITAGPPDTISIDGGPQAQLIPGTGDVQVQVGTTGETVSLAVATGYTTPGTSTGAMRSEGRMSWDGGQSWTAIDYAATNQQVGHASTGAMLNVDSTGILRPGQEQVSFGGTYDAFNVLVALAETLENPNGLGADEQGERLRALIGELDAVYDHALDGMRDLGARGAQVDLTRNRMANLELSLEEALSRDGDIDIAEVITRMNQQDVAYQASLAIGGRVLDQTLLDYL